MKQAVVINIPFFYAGVLHGLLVMRLTRYTDYALRVLLYTGAADDTVTISRISGSFDISKDHLRKVVHSLAQFGYLKTSQGRNGGITLAKQPNEINIREVVQKFESSVLVECFDQETNACAIDGKCGLKRALYLAQQSFLEVLEQYHLSDFIDNPRLVTFVRDLTLEQSET